MEESDLLKERLQAITEKHRIQEEIRERKLELDQEKLQLQHLKKKALREQWLLQDSASHNAMDFRQQQSLLSDQQQTRALQLTIHRMEMEVEFLEREESIICSNESFILDRLKAVEKSPEDIIKEAHENFVPEPLQVSTVVPDIPNILSPPANNQPEPITSRMPLFAMEVNVTKNLLTGESTVLSTAPVPPEELRQHTGLKVYDDGRKSVYALNSQQGSHDQICAPELSANEVEQLLRNATIHRQMSFQNYHHNSSGREEHCFYNHQDEREGCELRSRAGRHGNPSRAEKDPSWRGNGQRRAPEEHRHGLHDSLHRHNHHNLSDGGARFHHGNQREHHHSCYELRSSQSVQDCRPARHHSNGVAGSNGRLTQHNGYPPPRSHDQEAASAYRPQRCYTPASHIPLSDYITVEEEQLYGSSLPPYSHSHASALYRAPSPLYEDDTAYTILNTLDASEPITAVFMGFQTAQDDSGRDQEYECSLKAELVVIEDAEEDAEGGGAKEGPAAANGSAGRAGRRGGAGIKRVQKKSRPCCTVC